MSQEFPDHLMKPRLSQADYDAVEHWLRHTDGESRASFLIRWSAYDPFTSRLATATVNSRDEAITVVRAAWRAITSPNSQLTKHWTQFAVTKLGVRRVIRELGILPPNSSHVIDMACYWLPALVRESDAGFSEMKAFIKEAHRSGIIRAPVAVRGPAGTTLFADVYAKKMPKDGYPEQVIQ